MKKPYISKSFFRWVLIACFYLTVSAEEFAYTINNGRVTINGYTVPGGEITIPASIDDMPVIEVKGFYGGGRRTNQLTRVTISEGVERIQGFQNCRLLATVYIPASVKSIGRRIFYSCDNLTSITVDPNNQSYMSEDGVLFDKKQTVLMHYPAKKSGSYIIPDSVRSIESSAFDPCPGLTGLLTIPEGVTSIGRSEFRNCSSLTAIELPSTLSYIGAEAFYLCKELGSITVDTKNQSYMSEDGVLFDKNQTVLIQCPAKKTGVYSIPSGVKIIGELSFDRCEKLSEVIIPNSVSSIERSAFSYCRNLANLNLPDSIYFIGDYSFKSCSNLRGVLDIPDRVSSIQAFSFADCVGLIDVKIPEGVLTIEKYAFRNCRQLTSVVIPANVVYVGDSAFENCNQLHSLYFSGDTPIFGLGVIKTDVVTTIYRRFETVGWPDIPDQVAGCITAVWKQDKQAADVVSYKKDLPANLTKDLDSDAIQKIYEMGLQYFNDYGDQKDQLKAFRYLSNAIRYFRIAAEGGHSGAQHKLGGIYFTGRIVPRDYKLAIDWWLKAAKQGNRDAQYEIGKCYASGVGVAKNDDEAKKWLQLAANKGHKGAQEALKPKLNFDASVAIDHLVEKNLNMPLLRLPAIDTGDFDSLKKEAIEGDSRAQSQLYGLVIKRFYDVYRSLQDRGGLLFSLRREKNVPDSPNTNYAINIKKFLDKTTDKVHVKKKDFKVTTNEGEGFTIDSLKFSSHGDEIEAHDVTDITRWVALEELIEKDRLFVESALADKLFKSRRLKISVEKEYLRLEKSESDMIKVINEDGQRSQKQYFVREIEKDQRTIVLENEGDFPLKNLIVEYQAFSEQTIKLMPKDFPENFRCVWFFEVNILNPGEIKRFPLVLPAIVEEHVQEVSYSSLKIPSDENQESEGRISGTWIKIHRITPYGERLEREYKSGGGLSSRKWNYVAPIDRLYD